MDMNRIFCVANKEFKTGIRNKILLFLTLLMAGLAITIAYFGQQTDYLGQY